MLYSNEGEFHMAEDRKHVFDVEEARIFRTTLAVVKTGYYRVCVRYSHDNWDGWLKLEVVGETGETFTAIPPLPRKYRESVLLVRLFAGVNRISMAPRFDHPMEIRELELLGEAADLKPSVIPSADRFYLSEPRVKRLCVVSVTGAPVKITEGDREVPFELEDKALYLHADPVETREPDTYYHLKLHPDALTHFAPGEHMLTVHLPENHSAVYSLTVEEKRGDWDFRIVSLDVNHGNCVLLQLPNGKNLLIDTGTEGCAEAVIFPYLAQQGIGLDYCLISHYHGDHVGSLDAVLEKYPMAKPDEEHVRHLIEAREQKKREDYLSEYGYLDHSVLCRYDRLDRIWDLGGVEITVLNSRYEEDGRESVPGKRDGNDISVSLLVSYKGFRYYHGADNHAPNQRRNLEDFTAAGRLDDLQCHYMQANHHFHGDMLPEMIHAINPVAVLIPAHQAIFSRSAYMVDYLRDVVDADYPGKRLKDTFVSYFSGTVIVDVNSGTDWHYETY